MNTLQNINEYDFDEYINEKNFVVSLFTSHWCGPCQTQEMTLCSIMQKHDNEDIQFIKIDTDNSVDLVNSLSIRSIPTTIIFKNGKIVSEIIGAVSSDVVVQHLAHINNDENFQ
jgi:thioredoxin 1